MQCASRPLLYEPLFIPRIYRVIYFRCRIEVDALVWIPIWPGTHLSRDVLIAARRATVKLLINGIRAALFEQIDMSQPRARLNKRQMRMSSCLEPRVGREEHEPRSLN